ncbi:Endonuclease/Exonuclease/phosphatase [Dirofilaria immitis]|nr:Endonuclease/Exonuclease/phosphatase [Dirofilaria immitis]
MYRLLRNPPRCTKLVLKLKPLVGCPLMASFSLADNSREAELSFHWYVGEFGASLISPVLNISGGNSKYTMDGWIYRSTGRYFCPGVEDIGKRICVLLDMGTEAIIYCATSNDEVSRIDETLIFEKDKQFFVKNAQIVGKNFSLADISCFKILLHSLIYFANYHLQFLLNRPIIIGLIRNTRVISYNVLANLYLDLKLKQEDLHFPYCAKEHQNYDYRYPILLQEIPGYQADIIFLQEVDERLWLRFLPEKGMKVNEGLVACFRRQQFRYLKSHNMWLPDLLNTVAYPENTDIAELLKGSDELNTMFLSKPAVIQVLAVDSSNLFAKEDAIVLLANTHLYFDPRFEIIKILQSLLCARWIVRIATDYANHNPGAKLHILFAGDFNSTPDEAVYHLLSTGNISVKSEFFAYNQHSNDGVNFAIQPSFPSFSLKLKNLGDETQFTNYTRHYRHNGQTAGFEGCLDYIWGSANVKTEKVIPVPSKELAKKYVALPSKISPSDHLPLCTEFYLVHLVCLATHDSLDANNCIFRIILPKYKLRRTYFVELGHRSATPLIFMAVLLKMNISERAYNVDINVVNLLMMACDEYQTIPLIDAYQKELELFKKELELFKEKLEIRLKCMVF